MEKWILPAEWEWVPLSTVVVETTTRNPSQLPENTFYYIDISSIDNIRGKIKPINKICGKDAPSRARKVILKGDILFATTRPYLKNIVVVPEEYDDQICSTGFCVLRANDSRLIPTFLYYICRSNIVIDQLASKMRGASYPAVSDSDVLHVEIPLPSVGTQERIAQRIASLFIELAEAHRLHKKIETDTNRLMDAVLAEVIPNPENSLSNGWGFLALSDVATEVSNQLIPSEFPSEKFNYWGLDAISESQATEPAPNYVLGSEIKSSCVSFSPNHVLYSKLRPYLNKVIVPKIDGIGSTEWMVFEPNPKIIQREYLASVMRTKWFVNLASGSSYGARMPRANKATLRQIRIPIPFIDDPYRSLNVQDQIIERIKWFSSELETMKDGNNQQDKLLSQLEQSILTQAFRGEL